MKNKMWLGVGISCIGMTMILVAQAMRFSNEPTLYRYKIACDSVVATVTVHAPSELTQSEQNELREVSCKAIRESLEARFDESGT